MIHPRPPRTTIRVFAASPHDVAAEREILAGVVRQLDRAVHGLRPPWRVELCRWEDVVPSAGRPQHVINEAIGYYDVFVGCMWTRFGTPAGNGVAGTEEEYRLAYANWLAYGRPHILFYFSTAPMRPPRTVAEAEQLLAMVRFREELEKKLLIGEYRDPPDFGETVHQHLLKIVTLFLPRRPPRRARPRNVDPAAQRVQEAIEREQSQRTEEASLLADASEVIREVARSVASAAVPSNGEPAPADVRLSEEQVVVVARMVTRILNESRWLEPREEKTA